MFSKTRFGETLRDETRVYIYIYTCIYIRPSHYFVVFSDSNMASKPPRASILGGRRGLPCTPPCLDPGSLELEVCLGTEVDPAPTLKPHRFGHIAPGTTLPIQARLEILKYLHGLPSPHACALQLTCKGRHKLHGRDFQLVAPPRGQLSSMPVYVGPLVHSNTNCLQFFLLCA